MRVILLFSLLVLCSDVAFGELTIHAQTTFSGVYTQANGNGGAQFSGSAIPTNQLIEGVFGDYFSKTQISFTKSGNATALDFDISHNRSGHPGTASPGTADRAQSQLVSMVFSVNVPTLYELSGYYNVTDTLPSQAQGFPRGTDLTVSLSELVGASLFDQYQGWSFTPNGSTTVGVAGGDTVASYISGDLTGILTPGKNYIWSWNVVTYASGSFGGDAGASALGRMSLHTSAVPEPSSIVLGAFVMIGGVIKYRKRLQKCYVVN